jgi:hypothetical protein
MITLTKDEVFLGSSLTHTVGNIAGAYQININPPIDAELEIETNVISTTVFPPSIFFSEPGSTSIYLTIGYIGTTGPSDGDTLTIHIHESISGRFVTTFTITQGQVLCIVNGSSVLTPTGFQRIETIQKGHMIVTANGRTVRVNHVHKDHRPNPGPMSSPWLIPANCLGPNTPPHDVRVSRDHLVHVDGDRWVTPRHASHLSKEVVQYGVGQPVTYYNIMTSSYFTDDLVLDGGVIVESYGPRELVGNKDGTCGRRPKSEKTMAHM